MRVAVAAGCAGSVTSSKFTSAAPFPEASNPPVRAERHRMRKASKASVVEVRRPDRMRRIGDVPLSHNATAPRPDVTPWYVPLSPLPVASNRPVAAVRLAGAQRREVSMTALPDWMNLPPSGLSAEDYEALPENICRRIEIVDGAIIVSAAPRRLHQDIARRLANALEAACRPGLAVSTDVDLRLRDVPLLNRRPDAVVYDASLADDAVLRPLVMCVSRDARCWPALTPVVFGAPRYRRVLTPRLTTAPGPSSAGADSAVRRSVSRWSARRRSLWPNDLDT